MSLDLSSPPQTTGYLLLFRNTEWMNKGLSEDEVREVMQKVNAWFERLSASGKLVSAQPLFAEGVSISGKGGRVVTDGPFAEAKEAVGGYVLLGVASMEEAVEIAKSNPMHDHGLTTEVRATASTCPHLYQMFSVQPAAVT